jgi:DNA-binding transcriptional ArsR family regulator
MTNDFGSIARAIGDPVRAQFLSLLCDGRAWAAGELARSARVAPSTASAHLALLIDARLVIVHAQGRHRYYKLAGADVAEIIEKLGTIAPPPRIRSLSHSNQLAALRDARMCYGHLAGRLGVALHDRLIEGRFIEAIDDRSYALSTRGRTAFASLGVELEAPRSKRAVVYPCRDMSERRPHLGGRAASGIVAAFLERGWFERTPIPRAIRVTSLGEEALARIFDLPQPYLVTKTESATGTLSA